MWYSIYFLCGLACGILNLADNHGITLIQAYIHTHFNVKANFLSRRKFFLGWHLHLHIAEVVFQLRYQLEWIYKHPHRAINISITHTLDTLLPLGVMGLNVFNHPWRYQVSCIFTPSDLVPLVPSIFLVEQVTGQFKF